MSVDTLFDYLESPEGAADLDTLMSGSGSDRVITITQLVHIHKLDERVESFLYRLARHFYLQAKQEARGQFNES